ncbi:MAG: Hsp33 family molecular chaperone HslO [Holophagales bacterium]|nr:Hsp33 family molecular chaperone HslO [Holophagales bacterium]
MADELLPPLYAEASHQPGILRLGLAAGDLRFAAVNLSAPVEAMRRRLDPSPVAAVALGRAMVAATLLLRFSSRDPLRLRLEVLGDGPLGKVMAEVDKDGYLRAMVDQLRFEGDAGSPLAVGSAVGSGLLRVTLESKRRPAPWSSQTELVDGEIGNDLVHFLEQSQQIRSAALLGVLPSTSGIEAAGGVLVEALPGAPEAAVRRLEQNIAHLGGVGVTVRDAGGEGLLEAVLDGLEIEELEHHQVRYSCKCSRDGLLERLRTLTREDLQEVAGEDGKAIVECAFCLGQLMFELDELLTTH